MEDIVVRECDTNVDSVHTVVNEASKSGKYEVTIVYKFQEPS